MLNVFTVILCLHFLLNILNIFEYLFNASSLVVLLLLLHVNTMEAILHM